MNIREHLEEKYSDGGTLGDLISEFEECGGDLDLDYLPFFLPAKDAIAQLKASNLPIKVIPYSIWGLNGPCIITDDEANTELFKILFEGRWLLPTEKGVGLLTPLMFEGKPLPRPGTPILLGCQFGHRY